MQAEFAAKDKESTLQALKLLQEERDRLAAQQSYWEEFRQTAEQIETLKDLVSRAESEELVELRNIRDQSKILEGEHAALKKRFKEQEGKIANIERTSATARQNLAQAQQRSAEWERKAREFEGEVERLTTALDQAEQTKNQLDADYSLAKLQLEERNAEDRIAKVSDDACSLHVSRSNCDCYRIVRGNSKSRLLRSRLELVRLLRSLRSNVKLHVQRQVDGVTPKRGRPPAQVRCMMSQSLRRRA